VPSNGSRPRMQNSCANSRASALQIIDADYSLNLRGARKRTQRTPGRRSPFRPEIAEVEALFGRLLAIDRQEAELYGLSPKRRIRPPALSRRTGWQFEVLGEPVRADLPSLANKQMI
jgi:hypothetical protein